ncbi:MAG: ABC transporter permease [Planctomycetes bacterium]|nr:ABC transporter permease [Planctomycetota bacterium]
MSAPVTPERSPLGVFADSIEQTGYMIELIFGAFSRLFTHRHPIRLFRRLVEQLYVHAVKSLLVVTVVGTFTGMVLALQTGAELKNLGVEDQLSKIVAASLSREMGPFITGIILAATAGAAIAAELGTMKVSEEIDALELMNVDPIAFLVSPRIVSMGLSCLILTVWVNFVGIIGAAVVAHSQTGTLYSDFFYGARETLSADRIFGVLSKALFSGLVKAWCFGVIIGGLSCASGLNASGGALGVGRAVRTAVTASVVLTLIVGYILTWFFWA